MKLCIIGAGVTVKEFLTITPYLKDAYIALMFLKLRGIFLAKLDFTKKYENILSNLYCVYIASVHL